MNNTQKHQLYMLIAERTAQVLSTLIRWGVVLGIAYCLMVSVQAMAGTQTSFSVVVQMLASISADRYVAYIVAILFGAYGYNERRLRREKTEQLSAHIKELERRLDPNRTSSSLTPKGTTPKDKK
ncbi:MAG: hypothetical protein NT015_12875 [Alphaproteobacteria bacterium]|nr:hypothetical protein [Alphaproteobacteria bacterium]